VQKSSAEMQKKRSILAARINPRVDEPELLVEKQEWWSNPNKNMDDSFGAHMMGENNPSSKRHNMAMVSNPGICIYPTVPKQHKKAQTLESSNVAFQSRVSSFKTMHRVISKESCGRVTPDELNSTKRTSSNREPYSWNSEVQQFWATRNQKEIDESVKDFRRRNSSSLVSETPLLCEIDRGLAVNPTVPDTNFDESVSEGGEWGCGQYEWPLVRVKNPYHVGDDSKVANSTVSSVDNAAIMINEGKEFHKTENAISASGEYNNSFMNLEKQAFSANWHERERSFFLDEMSQRLDNSKAVGSSELSLSKVGMLGASESSQKSPTAASNDEVLWKMNNRNPLVDVNSDRFDGELQPSNIFSVEMSHTDYSMMSTGEAMLYGNKYLTKNTVIDEMDEKENQQPNNAEHYAVMLIKQPDQTTVPEQSSPLSQ